MTPVGKRVELIRRSDGRPVETLLYGGLRPEDLLLIEREWGPERLGVFQALIASGAPRTEWPQSLHWNWDKKAPELRLLEAQGFGVHADGSWQGAMLTKTASHVVRLSEDRGRPLVYVDYLEAAPWNWRVGPIGQEGRFKGAGSVLFIAAVEQSIEEGFHGRVGLHALPQAERFYTEACGMTCLGPDPAKQNLPYYELPRRKAEEILDTGGAK